MVRIKLVDGTLLSFEGADYFYKSTDPADYVVSVKGGGDPVGRVPFGVVLWADNGTAAVKEPDKF